MGIGNECGDVAVHIFVGHACSASRCPGPDRVSVEAIAGNND